MRKTKKEFRLTRALYSSSAINAAALEFEEVISIDIAENKNEYIITITPKIKEDIRLIKREFCNYVLGLMKEEMTIL